LRELRNLRLRRGLSQADLSAKTGVAEFTISEIEAGKRPNPRPSTLRKLAQGLGVEVTDLYGGPDNPLDEAPPSQQLTLNGELEEERRADWDAAVRSARLLRLRGRRHMEDALASWRASKEREEDPDERRAYLDKMGELLQRAYDAETALYRTFGGPLDLATVDLATVDLDEFKELQEADGFYIDLWRMVQRAGLSIRTDAEETTGAPETAGAGDPPPAARPEEVVESEAA
jgi:transcriptional regulator with XRE-family HTH domain